MLIDWGNKSVCRHLKNNHLAESIDLSSLNERHWTFRGKYLSNILFLGNQTSKTKWSFRMTPFQSNQTFHVFRFCQTRSKNCHNINNTNFNSMCGDANFLSIVCLPYSGAGALLMCNNINYQHKSNACLFHVHSIIINWCIQSCIAQMALQDRATSM